MNDKAQIYRDGFGNIIPNEDEIIRMKALEKLKELFAPKASPTSPRIMYTGNVRAGSVVYIEGDIRIEFYHEMGGGDCQLYIDIPTKERWEAATQTPLSRLDEIVGFVASTVRREQAPSWRYEIHENEIAFY
jgi:hypothetical protein